MSGCRPGVWRGKPADACPICLEKVTTLGKFTGFFMLRVYFFPFITKILHNKFHFSPRHMSPPCQGKDVFHRPGSPLDQRMFHAWVPRNTPSFMPTIFLRRPACGPGFFGACHRLRQASFLAAPRFFPAVSPVCVHCFSTTAST